jgi:hypothetical protein
MTLDLDSQDGRSRISNLTLAGKACRSANVRDDERSLTLDTPGTKKGS